MSLAHARIMMELRGYTVQSTSRNLEGFVKEHEGVTIHAYVSESGNNVEIMHFAENVTITTGIISATHPQFEEFESYVAQATHALRLCGV